MSICVRKKKAPAFADAAKLFLLYGRMDAGTLSYIPKARSARHGSGHCPWRRWDVIRGLKNLPPAAFLRTTVRRPVRILTFLATKKAPAFADAFLVETVGCHPRAKKPAPGSFFAHYGAPPCSNPHLSCHKKSTGLCRCFFGGDGGMSSAG